MARRRQRAKVMCGALALAGLLAACEIDLSVETVVEAPTGPVSLLAMNETGTHVVVRAAAAGATVPGPGVWRVERATGEAVALAGMTSASAVSRDGRRVLARAGGAGHTLWDSGSTATYPADAAFSDDLRFALRVGAAGTVERVDLVAGGAPIDVEAGLPRPADFTGAVPGGVSDDGTVVHFLLSRPGTGQRIQRLVDLGAGTVTDIPFSTSSDERFRLAAGGGAFVHHHQESFVDLEQLEVVVVASWFDVLDPATGAVLAHHDVLASSPSAGPVSLLDVSDDGSTVWYRQEVSAERCPSGSHPFAVTCVVDSQTTAVHDVHGVTTWDTGAGEADAWSLTSSGRLAAVSAERDFGHFHPSTWGPAVVLDRLTGDVETLGPGVVVGTVTGPALAAPVLPHIADGGRLVASASGNGGAGWYEHTPAEAAGS